MRCMCKVIRSDKVKRAGANGTPGPMQGTAYYINKNQNKTKQKTKTQIIIKTRLNLKDTKN